MQLSTGLKSCIAHLSTRYGSQCSILGLGNATRLSDVAVVEFQNADGGCFHGLVALL